MRKLFAATAIAALALSTAAFAAPVALQPVSYSSEFQADLNDRLGVREGNYLSDMVTRAVARELQERGATVGAGGATIELSIVDANPNRPTMQQLVDLPGLDPVRSISLGGAKLHAVIRGADGRVLTEVDHRRYDYSLYESAGAADVWQGARRAINRFAEKVADAYVAQTR